jgi:hypothetical protein
VFSTQIFKENTFIKIKLNFSFTEKCFPLTNFYNGKQTQESLKSDFQKSEFQKINIAKINLLIKTRIILKLIILTTKIL